MAYKIRSQLLPVGGLALGGTTMATTGVITTGSLNVNSGSTTISASGIGIGGGTKVTNLMYGSATFTIPAITASATTVAGTATVANLPSGAKVFLMPGTTGCGLVACAAYVSAASVISASFGTIDHAALIAVTSSQVAFNYVAFS